MQGLPPQSKVDVHEWSVRNAVTGGNGDNSAAVRGTYPIALRNFPEVRVELTVSAESAATLAPPSPSAARSRPSSSP